MRLNLSSNIRSLLFDFGGTLDSNGVHWRERTYRFIRSEHPEISRGSFDRADRVSVEQFVLGGRAPRLSLCESADAIATGIYERLGLNKNGKNRVLDRFCKDVEKCLEVNRRWLATLQDRYQLGVISNNFGNTQGWCDEYGLSQLLDVVIDSTVVGLWKPSPEIFQTALSELDVAPSEAVYTGDTYLDDVTGAKMAGLWTAWLVGREDKSRPDSSSADVQLEEIQDLERFLPE